MAYQTPSICPVCGQGLKVRSVGCDKCGTELSGRFSLCKYCALDEKNLRFIETFLRCRGSIKDAEKALGVSYPTVRNMLDQALSALGLTEEAAGASETASSDDILARVERGELTTAEAIELISKTK